MRSIVLVSLVVACTGTTPPAVTPEAPEPDAPEPAAAALVSPPPTETMAASDAAKKLGKTLKERLMAALGEGGPPAAITVCADEAQGITALVAAETGAKVGRASLQRRNAGNAGPDWVQAWLREHDGQPVADLQPAGQLVDVGGERMARFVAPIGIEAPCLACHGPSDGVPAEVAEVLKARYPADAATGYAVGDLRGALWAEVAVDATPAPVVPQPPG